MESSKKRILVLASGDAKGGGGGFQEMVEYSRTSPAILDAEIVAVVSNHENGGVWEKAYKLGTEFVYWAGPYDAEGYQDLVRQFDADYVMCSGWLKPVRGLNPRTVINIHPALLPGDGTGGPYGGSGMWGHHVHEAVYRDFQKGLVSQSGATMHFVTDYDEEGYDTGPVIWQMPVQLREDDTPDSIGSRVNQVERAWQSYILGLIVKGKIYLGEIDDEYKVMIPSEGLAKALPGIEWK